MPRSGLDPFKDEIIAKYRRGLSLKEVKSEIDSKGAEFSVRQYKNKLNDWGVFKNKCKASRTKGRQETQSNFAKREEIHRVTEKKARRRVEGKGMTSIPPNQTTALNMIAPEAYWMPTREKQDPFDRIMDPSRVPLAEPTDFDFSTFPSTMDPAPYSDRQSIDSYPYPEMGSLQRWYNASTEDNSIAQSVTPDLVPAQYHLGPEDAFPAHKPLQFSHRCFFKFIHNLLATRKRLLIPVDALRIGEINAALEAIRNIGYKRHYPFKVSNKAAQSIQEMILRLGIHESIGEKVYFEIDEERVSALLWALANVYLPQGTGKSSAIFVPGIDNSTRQTGYVLSDAEAEIPPAVMNHSYEDLWRTPAMTPFDNLEVPLLDYPAEPLRITVMNEDPDGEISVRQKLLERGKDQQTPVSEPPASPVWNDWLNLSP